MPARERRRGHPLTDRLEDLRAAEVRDQETEGEAARRGLLHEGPRPRPSLDETRLLEVAHRAADRDPRRTQTAHELVLARQPIARAVASAPQVGVQGREDLAMLGRAASHQLDIT